MNCHCCAVELTQFDVIQSWCLMVMLKLEAGNNFETQGERMREWLRVFVLMAQSVTVVMPTPISPREC
jgi:hypothetical protein